MCKKCVHVLIGKWETTSTKLESIGDWSKDFAIASLLAYKFESRLVYVRTYEKILTSNFKKSILGQWMWRMNLYPVLGEEKRERGGGVGWRGKYLRNVWGQPWAMLLENCCIPFL